MQDKTVHFTGEEYIKINTITKSFCENAASENPPKFVIFTGGIGSGKTTIRKQECTSDYVHFEFGEILNAVKKEFGENNPKLIESASLASDLILQESLENKKNIVIEIIGDDYEQTTLIIDKMIEIGYKISIRNITCDPTEAYQRHLKAAKEDPNYLSAYFTQKATLSFFYQHLKII